MNSTEITCFKVLSYYYLHAPMLFMLPISKCLLIFKEFFTLVHYFNHQLLHYLNFTTNYFTNPFIPSNMYSHTHVLKCENIGYDTCCHYTIHCYSTWYLSSYSRCLITIRSTGIGIADVRRACIGITGVGRTCVGCRSREAHLQWVSLLV